MAAGRNPSRDADVFPVVKSTTTRDMDYSHSELTAMARKRSPTAEPTDFS
jgi:hypothetical protein